MLLLLIQINVRGLVLEEVDGIEFKVVLCWCFFIDWLFAFDKYSLLVLIWDCIFSSQ